MDPPYPYNNAQPNGGFEKTQSSRLLTNTHLHATYPTYYAINSAQSLAVTTPYMHEERPRRRVVCVRLLHASIFLSIVCLLLSASFSDIRRFSSAIRDLFGSRSRQKMDDSPGLPSDCVQVAEWTALRSQPVNNEYPYIATTSLELPVESDLLYFLSHGIFSHGTLEIMRDVSIASDTTKVDVGFMYNSEDILHRTQVCLLRKGKADHGVGIFSPQRVTHPRGYRTHFNVRVRLPTSSQHPLRIKSFETNMPLFKHEISDLRDLVWFDKISLRTTNSAITAKYLGAETARISSTNAAITGHYNSTDCIEFRSSNGPISVDVNLINNGREGSTSRLMFHTSNAPVSADLSLRNHAQNASGGAFYVDAKSSNSPVNVNYRTIPSNAILNYNGATSNSMIRSQLHEAYEGYFSVKTSPWFVADVQRNEAGQDPSGKGRLRRFESRQVKRGVSEGNVWWEPSEKQKRGSVTLSTSNSPAQLCL